MIHLPINLETFGFVQREKHKGLSVRNKCGRDFLYYALHYYLPERFNKSINNPEQIDYQNMFGANFKGKSSTFLAWTQLQFYKMPDFLRSLGLGLEINNVKVSGFFKLIQSLLFPWMKFDDAVALIQNRVKEGKVTGVDIALKYSGLLDHVMFVYGYDEDSLYVFDTHQIPSLEYIKLTDNDNFYMKLPKSVIQKRWKRFSRVWMVNLDVK